MNKLGMAGRMERPSRRRQGLVARVAPRLAPRSPRPRRPSAEWFEWLPVAERRSCTAWLGRPAGGVRDRPTDEGLVKGRVGLVPGPEVEDAPAAPFVAAAAPEDLAALEPADQDEAIGRGDVEVLAVHLLVVDHEGLAKPGSDRMRRVDDPDPLAFAHLAPFEVAGRAHQSPEDPRHVTRMEHDQAHAVEHASVDAIDDVVADFVVGDVAPPRQDVRRREDLS